MENKTILLETERLILRRMESTDAEDMFKNYCSNDNVSKYVCWNTHKSLEDTKTYVNNVAIPENNEEYNLKWVLVLKETNEVIGCIDAHRADLKKKSIMLGWCLSESYWGQGLMPEAGKVVRDYLFSLGFVRIWAYHNIENPKSGRVMAKIGMTHEGTLRKVDLDNKGNLIDCDYWSIIKE